MSNRTPFTPESDDVSLNFILLKGNIITPPTQMPDRTTVLFDIAVEREDVEAIDVFSCIFTNLQGVPLNTGDHVTIYGSLLVTENAEGEQEPFVSVKECYPSPSTVDDSVR